MRFDSFIGSLSLPAQLLCFFRRNLGSRGRGLAGGLITRRRIRRICDNRGLLGRRGGGCAAVVIAHFGHHLRNLFEENGTGLLQLIHEQLLVLLGGGKPGLKFVYFCRQLR